MSNGSASDHERSRFQRVEHLFQAALDLPAERREVFLQTGEPDEEIRAMVRGLLERHYAGDTTLRAAVADAASMPSQLGPYQIGRAHV